MHSDPLHTGVDLQVHLRRDAHLARGFVDVAQLVEGGRGQGEAVAEEQRDLVAEDAAHDQDRRRDTGVAERDRFFEEADTQ